MKIIRVRHGMNENFTRFGIGRLEEIIDTTVVFFWKQKRTHNGLCDESDPSMKLQQVGLDDRCWPHAVARDAMVCTCITCR